VVNGTDQEQIAQEDNGPRDKDQKVSGTDRAQIAPGDNGHKVRDQRELRETDLPDRDQILLK
jgi:hypothetical protein